MTEDRKFNPAKRKKLNNPIRLEWIPTKQIWKLASIPHGTTYIDIGAGTGFLTTHISAHAPENTVIHALDIEPLMIREMEQTLPPTTRIRPQLMEKDLLPFADNSVDGVWLIALYHELTPPEPLLAEIRRVLRPEAAMVIVDWERTEEACENGPPLAHRVTVDKVIQQLAATGFTQTRAVAGFTFHFCLQALKPA